MSLAGASVIAIWNDITDEGRQNFYQWHDREHIPERVGIEGFLRGRRYIAVSGAPEFLTLYEVRDHAVLSGKSYLERLNNPTEWTTRSVRHFRNVSRSLCAVEYSVGKGSGGIVGTVYFDCAPEHDTTLLDRLAQRTLPTLLEAPGMVAAHVCRADVEASKAKTTEQRGRPDNLVPRWVILLEGAASAAIEAALSAELGPAAFAESGVAHAAHGVYRLEYDLLKA
ncbi:MAG TPA: hypothetical protein VN823_22860 [Stellaceae bacterium]|nr:hypothetical protein [Stellaceae bacterium]